MKKRKAVIAIAGAAFLALLLPLVIISFMPTRDSAAADSAPSAFSIAADGNYIACQAEGQCSAYAAAYVMRSLGRQVNGVDIYPSIQRTFGFVSPKSLANVLTKYGYSAKAYYGDISTVKKRVSEGIPVIVFISIPNDTHYAVITGYDEQYLYLADSLPENSNCSEQWYNRKVSADEFMELWKTNTILPDNIYIVVKPR